MHPTDSDSSAIHTASASVPLPVLQLRTWAVTDEPIHFVVAIIVVTLFTLFVYSASHALVAIGALFLLLVSLWRLLLPINYELDVRGVQQVVWRQRSFWRWSEFDRYEIQPRGVVLYRDGPDALLAGLAALRIPAAGNHLQLVSLVSSYVDKRGVPQDVYHMSTLAMDEFQSIESVGESGSQRRIPPSQAGSSAADSLAGEPSIEGNS